MVLTEKEQSAGLKKGIVQNRGSDSSRLLIIHPQSQESVPSFLSCCLKTEAQKEARLRFTPAGASYTAQHWLGGEVTSELASFLS